MAKAPTLIAVSESEDLLKRRLRKAPAAMRPRIKTLTKEQVASTAGSPTLTTTFNQIFGG